MSKTHKVQARRVMLRKVINLRAHYEAKSAQKRFRDLRDWANYRRWMFDGEAWLRQGRT